MRKIISLFVLALFFFQIAYLSYTLPQIILLGEEIPPGIKLSAAIAGICLGMLLLLKGYGSPLEKADEEGDAGADDREKESDAGAEDREKKS